MGYTQHDRQYGNRTGTAGDGRGDSMGRVKRTQQKQLIRWGTAVALCIASASLLAACEGERTDATDAARTAMQTGAAHDSAADAAKAAEAVSGHAVWIDVRTPQEYAGGHLDAASNIPYTEIAQRIAEVTTDRNAEINLYCRSGRRSGIAEDILKQMGYTNVHNRGGYQQLVGQAQ